MSEEPRDRGDWSRFDPHEAEREARRAERDARDAARDAERAGREAERQARREERRARHDERGGHVGMAFGFDAAEFAKSFMKDFVSDATGDTYSETATGEFTFERMPRLRVRNISGETTIVTGEPGKISVVATKRVHAGSEDRAKRLLQNLEIRMEQTGDELRVEPHLYEQERGWVDLFRGKRFRVDFKITVPVECAVDAQTVSGDLSVTGTRGPVDVGSTSGDVRLADAQGPLRLKAVSGDIDVRRYVGHVEGNTVSGDVTFDAVRLRSTQLHTVSGDIEIAGLLEPAREHRFRTISGDVELSLADADLLVEFRSASGDCECETPARVTRQGRKDYSVGLGAARGHALVKTVSGDLTVRESAMDVPGEPSTEEPRAAGGPMPEGAYADADLDRAPAQGQSFDERTQPMDAMPGEDARAVLERLAKGELNVDDAAAALDQARKGR